MRGRRYRRSINHILMDTMNSFINLFRQDGFISDSRVLSEIYAYRDAVYDLIRDNRDLKYKFGLVVGFVLSTLGLILLRYREKVSNRVLVMLVNFIVELNGMVVDYGKELIDSGIVRRWIYRLLETDDEYYY